MKNGRRKLALGNAPAIFIIFKPELMRVLKDAAIYVLLSCLSCYTDHPYRTQIMGESYGPDPRNKMDVFLPSRHDSTTEVIILIHGGAWVAGDKKDFSNSGFTDRFLQNGYAVASINYRYACGDIHKQMGDIDMAVRNIMSKAQSWNIADSSFALLGGSAGGHLALLYAHAFDSLHVVKAAVSIVGPTDLTDTLFHRYTANYQIENVFEQLLGVKLANDQQTYRDASPIFNRGNVPSLFIYGRLDDLVPYQHGVRMNDSLAKDGVASNVLIFDNAGHNVFGDKNQNMEIILSKVMEWMRRYLDGK